MIKGETQYVYNVLTVLDLLILSLQRGIILFHIPLIINQCLAILIQITQTDFHILNQLIRVGQENRTRINLYSVFNNISINLRRRSSVG